MDPAALGTTIIGLDKIRHDDFRDAADPLTEPSTANHRRLRGRSSQARERIAHFLRRTADHIAPSPTPA